MKHLTSVFDVLRVEILYINFAQCSILQSQAIFLGFAFSRKETSTDSEKIHLGFIVFHKGIFVDPEKVKA